MSDDAIKKDEVLEDEVVEETAQVQEEPQAEAEQAAEETKEEAKDEKQADPEEEALNLKYMRLMADFQNFKRRTEKEKGDIYAFANE